MPTNIVENDEPQAEFYLPRLKYLHLCRPAKGKYDNNLFEDSWSSRADQACLADWRRLLLACSRTVEVLVLEQRSGRTYTGDDLNSESMRSNKEGIGSEALVDMVASVLSDRESFPMLSTVYLLGISVGLDFEGKEMRQGIEKVPGRQLMQLLKRQGVACEARLGTWCNFDEWSGCANWSQWSPDSDDEEEGNRWDTVLATV